MSTNFAITELVRFALDACPEMEDIPIATLMSMFEEAYNIGYDEGISDGYDEGWTDCSYNIIEE